MPHLRREALACRYPVHITLDVVQGLPSLRTPLCMKVVWPALADSARKHNFRITQFSVQDRHLHLIAEAHDRQALTRGIQGFKVRLARRLNRRLGRTGSVFADRYHDHILRTPREVHRALRHVLCNADNHVSEEGWRFVGGEPVDTCTSAAYFDGWKGGHPLQKTRAQGPGPPPVAEPRTWLLKTGWRRYGLLHPDASPAPASARKQPRP